MAMNSMAVHSGHTRAQGVALPVVMVFVLMMTMLALFSMRSSIFSETMSRNQVDVLLARQAAEAALRDAELDLLIARIKADTISVPRCTRAAEIVGGDLEGAYAAFLADCTKGLCEGTPDTTSDYATRTNPRPWWPVDSDSTKSGLWNDDLSTKPLISATTCNTFTGGVPMGTFTGAAPFGSVARQPEYLIERYQLTSGKSIYRLTARGFGADERTEIVLQSHFDAPSQVNP